MSCYNVDYNIDMMEAFELMADVDKHDFLVDAIRNFKDYNDDLLVVVDAAENLDEVQKSDLALECFETLDGNTALGLVQELASRLNADQQKRLINYLEDY